MMPANATPVEITPKVMVVASETWSSSSAWAASSACSSSATAPSPASPASPAGSSCMKLRAAASSAGADHVEACQEGRDEADDRDQVADRRVADPGTDDGLVFGPEAGEGDDAGVGRGGDEEGPEGDRHVVAQAAHPPHVLLLVQTVDDRAGAEEEESLEEGVRHQVEDRGDPGAGPEGKRHVAKLAERGVGDDSFDVELG